jgi:chromosome segregation ATPase
VHPQETEEARAALHNAHVKLQMDHHEEVRRLEKEREEAVAAAVLKGEEAVRERLATQEAEAASFRAQLTDLQTRLNELEDYVERREARPEDVEAIHGLQRALNAAGDRAEDLQEAYEQLKLTAALR